MMISGDRNSKELPTNMKAVVQVLKYLFSDDKSAHEVLHDFGHNGRLVLHWIEFLKQNKYIEENNLGEFVPTYKGRSMFKQYYQHADAVIINAVSAE